MNILLYPVESESLVQEPNVGIAVLLNLRPSKKAKSTKTIVGRHVYQIAFVELLCGFKKASRVVVVRAESRFGAENIASAENLNQMISMDDLLSSIR